ncbi:MAG: signal peptidase II [Porticoccaceae bacterium]
MTTHSIVVRSGALLGWYALALLVVVVDQLTKGIASAYLDYARPVMVTSFFNWTLLHNPGAAFSFLSDAGGWQRWLFLAISTVVSLVIVVWMALLPRNARLQLLALGLILGGAIGNLWDRLMHGFVVDFIQLHYGGYYFPAFNIADSAITVGAAILIVDSLFGRQGR